jgi:hypothetical protein
MFKQGLSVLSWLLAGGDATKLDSELSEELDEFVAVGGDQSGSEPDSRLTVSDDIGGDGSSRCCIAS